MWNRYLKTPWTTAAIAALSLFIFDAAAVNSAEPVKPFSQWVAENPNWASSKSEVAYAITRCGALLFTVGSYGEDIGATEEVRNNARDLKVRGTVLSVSATPLNKELGLSPEFIDRRTKLLMRSYLEQVSNNRAVHNNLFHGSILSDIQFCRSVEATYRK